MQDMLLLIHLSDTISQVSDAIKQAGYIAQDLNEEYLDLICLAYDHGDTDTGNRMARQGCERWSLMCNLLGTVLTIAEDTINNFYAEHKDDLKNLADG